MGNVYYFNITFRCNNDCRFCFSHTTKFQKRPDMTLDQIRQAVDTYGIGSGDRVIVNGGEPTLYRELPHLQEIVGATGAEVVLYSNGIRFADWDYCERIAERGLGRITIPVHGTESVHDALTANPGSFEKTNAGLRQLMQMQAEGMGDFHLEIKFILTKGMIESGFSIGDYLHTLRIGKEHSVSLVLCGVVETKVSRFNGYTLPDVDEVCSYLTRFLDRNREKLGLSLKLYDLPLCRLEGIWPERLKKIYEPERNERYDSYFYFDHEAHEGHRILYDKETDFYSGCETCEIKSLCNRIVNRYRVLCLENERCFTTLE